MEDYSAYAPWIVMAVNGLIAGWLASMLLGGRGGVIRDIFIGIIGAFVGGALVQGGLLKLPFLEGMPWLHLIVVSTVGAVLVVIFGRIVGR
jgi:uncharacterized membrane protein YeaQ/YmgE (transglycosylase-associated protein family)